MKHKHAELMAEYAKDAMETDKPWERWECRYDSMPWEQMQHQPMWDNRFSYRRKPMPKEITEQSDVDLKMRAAASAAASLWTCCGRSRRSKFCPECGTQGLVPTGTIEIKQMLKWKRWHRILESMQTTPNEDE